MAEISPPALPRALSLHIGLNAVDPGHYQGWSGALVACEHDAADMAAIATREGYAATSLLTRAATRIAVIDGIRAAAAALERGGIFLLTYAGHGGQLPDRNGDEADGRDETWCLYDGELIDDELFELWSRFKAGVRILIVSDSCHSGSVARMALAAAPAGGALLAGAGRRVRAMPRPIADRVYRANRPFYEAVAAAVQVGEPAAGGDDSAIGASVRLLSACQDNQLAGDGDNNGRFTEELLKVWADGRFAGDYKRFHRAIVAGMPPDQSPNHMLIGPADPAFDAQKPFAI